ncbi:hypothetical protein [Oceanospirillum maris]|uniref:hypothetical protein n=1 Tax=Oceanospirillum maris TaxID=64977 RepID=UPI000409F406|nr:hypothetical protein [Oceanospirillum maris]
MRIEQGRFNLSSTHETFQHISREESLNVTTRTNGVDKTVDYKSRDEATQTSSSYYGAVGYSNTGPEDDGLEIYNKHSKLLGNNNGANNLVNRQASLANGQDGLTGTPRFDPSSSLKTEAIDDDDSLEPETIEELRMLTFIRLMEQMFGLIFSMTDDEQSATNIKDAEKLRALGEQMEATKSPFDRAQNANSPRNGQQITYTAKTVYHEEEHTRMSAQGRVTTEDGRTLDLSLDIGMSREFRSEDFVSITEGNLKDPLVINFDRSVVGLSDKLHFQFDLDADGTDERLPELLAGSGYLALDLNQDGLINSGNELFGAKTGDGFEELAQYDDDGNGFIDENDEIFSQLKIWVPRADGQSELYALLDKDVGAIYLKSQNTPFALKTALDNETQGYVRESGVFLNESGGIGSVQQIDLKV